MIDLIYTSGNNRRYAQMALDAGWLVGIRSDKHAYNFPISFVDVKYNQPNFQRHLELVKTLCPRYAVVPDFPEHATMQADILRVLRQAEQLSLYCDVVLIVPKRVEQLALIPADFTIGFSVVSSYGGFDVCFLDEQVYRGLKDRRIHLLGGSPHRQMDIYLHLSSFTRVLSADGNMMQRLSGKQKYWHKGAWIEHPRHGEGDSEVTHQCIEWSLRYIRDSWRRITSPSPQTSATWRH